MPDIYLYEGTDVLKNLLDIRDRKLLEEAEADYVTYRLKEIAINPLPGDYDYTHFLQMHKYIFQDMYEWAGQQRKLNIYKEEPVLGGLSIDYSDRFDIPKDSERALSEMRNKPWSDMDTHEASTEELLKSYLNDGIITVGDVRVLKMEDLKQMIIDKVHKYSITKQKDGRWSTYIPDQTKPAGRRLIKRKSKADLNKFLLEFYHLRDNASLMTFGELFSKWVAYKKQFIGAENRKRGLSPSTIRRYERDFDHYIKGSKLDKTLICEITRISLEIDITSIIKRYDMLEQNASNLIGYICQAMLFARRSEYITVNPAETIDKALLLSVCRFNPPKDDSERVLTLREYHELYEAVLRAQASHPEYMPNYAIELAMLTGMRVGEIAALHWSDIDEDFIHIDFSEHRLDYSDRKSELVIDEPKNGKHRVVQMTEKIKAVFEKVKDIGFTSDENFVFCRKDGRRYTGHDISCACDRRAKEAGIKKTSIHGIRRTMSSMLNTILPEKAVADMLGHTERVNERHYNYCMAENAEKKAALDQVYSKVFKISDYKPEEKKTGSA